MLFAIKSRGNLISKKREVDREERFLAENVADSHQSYVLVYAYLPYRAWILNMGIQFTVPLPTSPTKAGNPERRPAHADKQSTSLAADQWLHPAPTTVPFVACRPQARSLKTMKQNLYYHQLDVLATPN